ncbi:MAG: hypothetical protein E7263_04265 [Lachnospiraceae bacterium]|nr:hypothetical protein [Lachnospiraceae bacterium]
MGVIMLTASQLEAKKEELSSLNSTLKTQIKELQMQIKSLDAEWEGNAADAYKARSQKDIGRMENLCSVIDSYVKALDTIIAEYKKAESMNVATAKN